MTDPLYAAEIRRHVLALREALVRFDENLKADELMQRAVPFFLLEDEEIAQARQDQEVMVLHIRNPDVYAEYYGTNPHERPFEEQYGIRPEDAHEALYRVAFLRKRLEQRMADGEKVWEADPAPDVYLDRAKVRILDLSANDGWMAVNLGQLGYTVDCVDLHPGNCEIAERRTAAGAPGIGEVWCGDLHDAPTQLAGWPGGTQGDIGYDVVVCFETVEHTADPDATLEAMVALCKPGGRLYLSTPFEAVERGNLDNWAHVEPKGHVRVFRAQDFEALCERHGTVKRFEVGPDRVMVAEVEPRGTG